eukprot:scaffold8005_cov275-Amphora_coffeaeformis.AAC.40
MRILWASLSRFLGVTGAFVAPGRQHLSSTTTPTLCTMTTVPEERPFGAWESPITSKSITAGSVKLGSIHVLDQKQSSDDESSTKTTALLYWLEGRPQEGGRNVLCRYNSDATTTTNQQDVSPTDVNVRTRVHEYGGGAVTLSPNSAPLIVNFATQQLCRLVPNKEDDDGDAQTSSLMSCEPITADDNRFRFADGVLDEKTGTLYCVREDHLHPEPKHVVNEIVAVDTQTGDMTVVATGNDFYAAPRLSPDGQSLAYVTWNHPQPGGVGGMPWDDTELRLTRIDNNNNNNSSNISAETASHTLVAGQDGDTSILQPLWHPTTGDLYYISDASGYYNIYRYKMGDSTSMNVLPMDYDFGGPAPGWVLGQQGFTFLPQDGRLAAQYSKDGKSVLVVATVIGNDDGPTTDVQEYGMDDGLPMQFGSILGTTGSNDLYFTGGSPSTPTSIYKWNLSNKQPAEILVCSSSLKFPEGFISIPQQVEFPTTNNKTAFGYYYPPKNDNYQCTTEDVPTLLVKAHGGPTACTGTSFNAGIQFWTSRGFAVLDVDYSGSTGYGREYRRRLRKSWGIVDIDDVCAGAQYLVAQGLADANRLCIDGGSAGGYTTLGALAFRDVFRAGCSLYGIGDLTALAGDTHKFESRYLDGLVGEYPKDEAIYKERSPIESVDTLSCPILILQGEEDKIVPPNQARMMHEALLKKGIPTCLKIYEGEQHGFRKAENIEDALDSELAFYGKVFGIDIPGAVDIKIDNM